MVEEIQTKSILSRVKQPDSWFGLRYSMNLYRGCQHQCIYCDSRSACYQIQNFSDIQVKTNALELLDRELARKRKVGTIGTGSMNDPYMPLESSRQLTRQALQVIAARRFPVHVLTKSDMVLRDLDVLKEISQVYTAVSFTITTPHDSLGKQLEPGASLVSARLKALEALANNGILTGVLMMPILPFLEDRPEDIRLLVERAANAGAGYILASFGMTLRDRQRDYYYRQLDRLFPGQSDQYRACFGEQYWCSTPNANQLLALFEAECKRHGVATRIPFYNPNPAVQLELFS